MMVGVEAASSLTGGRSPRKEVAMTRTRVDDKQAERAQDEWTGYDAGFGIPAGTLELVEVTRKRWRRPMELPLPPPSPEEAPILQEFSRPWHALRLPVPPPMDGHSKVDESFLKSYDSQYTPGEPTFASDLQASSILEPRVAVAESQAFLIKPHVRFALGMVEPLVCRMVAYDITSGSRATEEFCFRIPGPMLDKLDCAIPPAALVYVLPKIQLQNLFLVLKVTKVLVGDSDNATAPYCAPDKHSSPGEQQKLVDKAADCAARLGRFQQPLAWGVIPFAKGMKRSMTLYRQRCCIPEEQRLLLIADAIRGTLKEKTIPAQCEFDIDQVSEEELYEAKFGTAKHDSSGSSGPLLRLEIADPFSEQIVHESGKPENGNDELQTATEQQEGDRDRCREVQPFCPLLLVPTLGLAGTGPVAVSYVNALYLYPLQIEKCQYRNLAIRVQLLQKEVDAVRGVEETNNEVLRVVYTANNQVGRSAYASVGYHQKNPQFDDELKICLPECLTMEHHLLFTFYHVHCKKLQLNQPQQELIGYAALPLLSKDGTILQDSKYAANVTPAPVVPKVSATGGGVLLPPGYVGVAREGVVDSSKTVFSCRSRVISSIHSHDSAVAGFLRSFHSLQVPDVDEDTIVGRLMRLNESSAPNVRYYFFMIAKFVLGYLRYGTSLVRWSAFRTLLGVMEKASWNPQGSLKLFEMNRVLHDFVHIVFDESSIDDPNGSTSPKSANGERKCYQSVFSALLETWLNVLNNKTSVEENVETKRMSLTYSNVLLQLILKSMAMHLLGRHGTHNNYATKSLPKMLAKNDEVMLERVLCLLMACAGDKSNGLLLQKEVNRSVAYFCRGVFLASKNTLSARVLTRYMNGIDVQGDANSLRHIWLPFLHILVDFEFFPTINGAVPAGGTGSMKPRAWLAKFIFKKLLLIVDTQKEHKIRVDAVRLLRRMFTVQVCNPRFQSPEEQEMVALLYYPFIPCLAQFTTQGKLLSGELSDAITNNCNDTARQMGDTQSTHDLKKEILACAIHLLCSVSDPNLPFFFQAMKANDETHQIPLGCPDMLTHYHYVVKTTSWRLQSTEEPEITDAEDNNSDDTVPKLASTTEKSFFDEARVHACLALIRHILDIFLVTKPCGEQLWQQLLAPDLSGRDTETGLSLLEHRLSHRRSFHRRTGLGIDSVAALTGKPNIGDSSSLGEAVQNGVDSASGNTTHRSLPRNWSKHYAGVQQRRSNPSGATEEKLALSSSGKAEGGGNDHDEEIAVMQHSVASSAMRVLQTAVDQYESLIELIKVARTPQLGKKQRPDTCIDAAFPDATSQALVLLGSLTELLFQLLHQASSIEHLATKSNHNANEPDDDEANDTSDGTKMCFVARLLMYLQSFVWRFSAALFAARIPGLPMVHDQRRIRLLVTIASTARDFFVRRHTATLLSQLLAVCYEQTGSFLLMKAPILKVLTAVFFPVPGETELPITISTTSLRDLLDEMRTFATTSRDTALSLPFSFHIQFIDLLNDLTAKVHSFERCRDAFESPEGAHDFEEIEEGIDRVVDDISQYWLLEEKLVWLNALLQLHLRRDRFAEAACCKISAIKCVLQTVGAGDINRSQDRVQQWVVRELLLARSYAAQADWVDKELSICEQLLVRLKQQQRFREYQETLQYVDTVVGRLAERHEGGVQLASSTFSFYRVQYAGGCVSARIANDEFIYKRCKFMSLGEFIGEMKTMLRAKYLQCERVDVIPEPKPLVSSENNPYVIFLRVTTVEEAPIEDLARLRTTKMLLGGWRVAFKFAVPFTVGSSSSYGKTAEQMKRITYLLVERTFPCRLNRQLVQLRYEEVRCPIDNSMDDIRKRCALLRIEIDNERVGRTDLKSLTLVLKGSVDTHVHGGVPEVLDSFLADPSRLYDAHGGAMSSHDSLRKRHELANLLVEFAQLCWQCLLISREAFRRSNQPVGSQHVISQYVPLSVAHSTHSEQRPLQVHHGKPDGSFLPPLFHASSLGSLRKVATSHVLVSAEADSNPPLVEVSPLQTEFERSFAALVDQIRTKISFTYRSADDLALLHQRTKRLRAGQTLSPPPPPQSAAAVSPLPPQTSMPSSC